jgi:transcriptional regulator GlxA family with amidase domain
VHGGLDVKAGLLEGLSATTHHEGMKVLKEVAPDATREVEERFVDNGRILLSAGISAGIDASLHVVAKLLGTEQALKTARYMEYEWEPTL